jgi:hypothetical protein
VARVEGLARLRLAEEETFFSGRHREASDKLRRVADGSRDLLERVAKFQAVGFEMLSEGLGLDRLAALLPDVARNCQRAADQLRPGVGRPPETARRNHVLRLADLWESTTSTKATHYLPGSFWRFARACIMPVDPTCADDFICEAVRSRNRGDWA